MDRVKIQLFFAVGLLIGASMAAGMFGDKRDCHQFSGSKFLDCVFDDLDTVFEASGQPPLFKDNAFFGHGDFMGDSLSPAPAPEPAPAPAPESAPAPEPEPAPEPAPTPEPAPAPEPAPEPAPVPEQAPTPAPGAAPAPEAAPEAAPKPAEAAPAEKSSESPEEKPAKEKVEEQKSPAANTPTAKEEKETPAKNITLGAPRHRHVPQTFMDIRKRLEEFIKKNTRLVATWIQMGFHSCIGGCDGCIDVKLKENKGLIDTYANLRSNYTLFKDRLSFADFVSLAAVVAAEDGMHRPLSIPFAIGRKTCDDLDKVKKDGHFPKGDDPKALKVMMDEFGFTEKEGIALMGAHSVGRCQIKNSGFDGTWDFTSAALDNGYWKSMQGTTWFPRKISGTHQWQRANDSLMMLISDLVIMKQYTVSGPDNVPSCKLSGECKDAPTRKYVQRYADSKEEWQEDFIDAYKKMLDHVKPGNPVPQVTNITDYMPSFLNESSDDLNGTLSVNTTVIPGIPMSLDNTTVAGGVVNVSSALPGLMLPNTSAEHLPETNNTVTTVTQPFVNDTALDTDFAGGIVNVTFNMTDNLNVTSENATDFSINVTESVVMGDYNTTESVPDSLSWNVTYLPTNVTEHPIMSMHASPSSNHGYAAQTPTPRTTDENEGQNIAYEDSDPPYHNLLNVSQSQNISVTLANLTVTDTAWMSSNQTMNVTDIPVSSDLGTSRVKGLIGSKTNVTDLLQLTTKYPTVIPDTPEPSKSSLNLTLSTPTDPFTNATTNMTIANSASANTTVKIVSTPMPTTTIRQTRRFWHMRRRLFGSTTQVPEDLQFSG